MKQLLLQLKNIPEYAKLLDALARNQAAAVTGIGQINRSHMIAGLAQDLCRPLVILCQDDMAAKRMQEELKNLYLRSWLYHATAFYSLFHRAFAKSILLRYAPIPCGKTDSTRSFLPSIPKHRAIPMQMPT